MATRKAPKTTRKFIEIDERDLDAGNIAIAMLPREIHRDRAAIATWVLRKETIKGEIAAREALAAGTLTTEQAETVEQLAGAADLEHDAAQAASDPAVVGAVASAVLPSEAERGIQWQAKGYVPTVDAQAAFIAAAMLTADEYRILGMVHTDQPLRMGSDFAIRWKLEWRGLAAYKYSGKSWEDLQPGQNIDDLVLTQSGLNAIALATPDVELLSSGTVIELVANESGVGFHHSILPCVAMVATVSDGDHRYAYWQGRVTPIADAPTACAGCGDPITVRSADPLFCFDCVPVVAASGGVVVDLSDAERDGCPLFNLAPPLDYDAEMQAAATALLAAEERRAGVVEAQINALFPSKAEVAAPGRADEFPHRDATLDIDEALLYIQSAIRHLEAACDPEAANAARGVQFAATFLRKAIEPVRAAAAAEDAAWTLLADQAA